jgi:glycosyltransferase involved in cell wall biosynthesis
MTKITVDRKTTLPSPGDSWDTRIAVLIPCFNEEATVGTVVTDFRHALPSADIYVYDNNSGDGTIAAARKAGAIVRSESLRGKGNVVRRMFADIEADIYILVDGDNTYDAAAAPALALHLVEQRLDLVNARRISGRNDTHRFGHRTGNAVVTWIVARVFGNRFTDMLSGYKALSRRFVKSFPITASSGFEIETELTVHALELNMPIGEVPSSYKERPAGSSSKLRTLRDGLRIIWTIFVLVKEERPLAFFSAIFALLTTTSLILAAPIVVTFIETSTVPRLPTAVLATGEMLLAFLSLACGLILDTVTRGRKEMKQLHYLLLAAVLAEDR